MWLQSQKAPAAAIVCQCWREINKRGASGQGGVLRATGHAYIGRNPIPGSDTNEDNTTVKLIDVTGE